MHVRLADDDRAGGFQRRDRLRIARRHTIDECLERRGRPHARRVVEILDGDRYTMQRPATPARHDLSVCLLRLRPRLLSQDRDERVQPRVQIVDSRQACLDRIHSS